MRVYEWESTVLGRGVYAALRERISSGLVIDTDLHVYPHGSDASIYDGPWCAHVEVTVGLGRTAWRVSLGVV